MTSALRTPEAWTQRLWFIGLSFAGVIAALLTLSFLARVQDWRDLTEDFLFLSTWLLFVPTLVAATVRETSGPRAEPSPGSTLRWIGRWTVWTLLHVALVQGMLMCVGASLLWTAGGQWDPFSLTNLVTLDLFLFPLLSTIAVALMTQERLQAREIERLAVLGELESTRLGLLRAQLDPHFLFNALNSILVMVHESPSDARSMVKALREFLANVLDLAGRDTLPLGEEVRLARAYCDLQRIRFESRLRVDFDVAPETLTLEVPALVLQPLLENSIKHGLERHARVHVRVVARLLRPAAGESSSQWLELLVLDDGGAPETVPLREGVGLSNTRARLQALYADRQNFSFSLGVTGVRVTLHLPVEGAARPAA